MKVVDKVHELEANKQHLVQREPVNAVCGDLNVSLRHATKRSGLVRVESLQIHVLNAKI